MIRDRDYSETKRHSQSGFLAVVMPRSERFKVEEIARNIEHFLTPHWPKAQHSARPSLRKKRRRQTELADSSRVLYLYLAT